MKVLTLDSELERTMVGSIRKGEGGYYPVSYTHLMLCMAMTMPAMAQFNVKALKGAAKAVKAVTLTDAQMAEYVKEYILSLIHI